MSETTTSVIDTGLGVVDDVIRTEGIAKRFGQVVALQDVSMHLRRGEVLGLIGDNGAGKSTFIKILTGFHQPDNGKIFVNGEEVALRSVSHARELGIETVHQGLALIDDLPVYLNLHLNKEFTYSPIPILRKREMRRRAREVLDDMGIGISSVNAPVEKLSGGQRQAIAVARSVYSDAKVLLLDEPLAAMGAKEGAIILDLIMRLKKRGDVAIIMIAHNYAQIVDVCDRVNLIQHGRITFDEEVGSTSVDELTALVSAEYRRQNNGPDDGRSG